jgi:hypothetical protein
MSVRRPRRHHISNHDVLAEMEMSPTWRQWKGCDTTQGGRHTFPRPYGAYRQWICSLKSRANSELNIADLLISPSGGGTLHSQPMVFSCSSSVFSSLRTTPGRWRAPLLSPGMRDGILSLTFTRLAGSRRMNRKGNSQHSQL